MVQALSLFCHGSSLPCSAQTSRRCLLPTALRRSPVSNFTIKAAQGSYEGADRVGAGSPSTTQRSVDKPPASSETIKEAQNAAQLFLRGELQRIFEDGLTKEKYTKDFTFQDPVVKADLDSFARSIGVLKSLFKVNFIAHSVNITGDTTVTTRWSMELQPRLTPWIQKLVFTGRSFYTIDVLSGGKISGQRDVWDAVQDNSYFSLEGLAHVIQQITNGQTSPKLESPRYAVLKKRKEYEVRRYDPFLQAELSMPSNSKPASGDGFQDLANYIFGGNQRKAKMEMTTPVYTTAGQGSTIEGKMSFPMEEKEGQTPEELPVPENARVRRSKDEGGFVASAQLGGLPLDFQVTDTERRLRAALLYDGLKPEQGYKLARYNDPFTPLFLRRNEVLIKLEDFQLEPAS